MSEGLNEVAACALQGSPGEKEQAGLVLLEVLEAARVVAVMLTPIAPSLARLIQLQLGYTHRDIDLVTWADAEWGGELLLSETSSWMKGSWSWINGLGFIIEHLEAFTVNSCACYSCVDAQFACDVLIAQILRA